ncbi:MAG: hypothetical protein Q8N99_02410 [Nanoarchaeota archaeon]|nr:hypothetical protein [Nanoarchaeota archaeon]
METAEQFIKRKEQEYSKEKGKPIKFKDIGRKGKHHFIREDYVFMKQSNLPVKVFIFERLRKVEINGKLAYNNSNLGAIEYRIGYYIIGKIGRMNGKWTWGQYCPLIPQKDFEKLIKLAKEKGVLL